MGKLNYIKQNLNKQQLYKIKPYNKCCISTDIQSMIVLCIENIYICFIYIFLFFVCFDCRLFVAIYRQKIYNLYAIKLQLLGWLFCFLYYFILVLIFLIFQLFYLFIFLFFLLNSFHSFL